MWKTSQPDPRHSPVSRCLHTLHCEPTRSPQYVASSLSLDMGVSFFGGFQWPPVKGCSTASCDFGALAGGDEHTSFYFAVLNQKLCFVLALSAKASSLSPLSMMLA